MSIKITIIINKIKVGKEMDRYSNNVKSRETLKNKIGEDNRR